MGKKIVDNQTVGSGGGTHRASFEKEIGDHVVLRVVGDANTSNLDIDMDDGRIDVNASDADTIVDSESFTSQDQTSDDNNSALYRFEEADGYREVTFVFTNNAASDTSLDAYAEGYSP